MLEGVLGGWGEERETSCLHSSVTPRCIRCQWALLTRVTLLVRLLSHTDAHPQSPDTVKSKTRTDTLTTSHAAIF